MEANAPERLYLSKTIYGTYLYQVPDPDDETAVEYIHADTFIERACEWLSKHAIKYYLGGSKFLGTDELVEDFKIAMTL